MKPDFVATATDSQWDRLSIPERALHVARGCEVWKVREELGSNHGKWVDKFLAFVGLKPGYAWCAAFVAWCLGQAGADKANLPKHAPSVIGWYTWAKQTGRLTGVPKRNRLFY